MKLSLFFIALVPLFLASCTRKVEERSTLNIKFPSNPFQKGVVSSSSTSQKIEVLATGAPDWNTSLQPSTIAEINCYALFVGGPEAPLKASSCSDSTSGEVKFRFGIPAGFFPQGSQVSVDVPSGADREITLVGFKTQGTACSSSFNNPDFSNMSFPHIISTKVQDLAPGDVNIDMVASLNTSNTFDICDFINPGSGGDSPEQLFGDASDGDITFDGSTHNASTANYSSVGSYSGGEPSKIIGASLRINNILPTNGKVITLETGTSIPTTEFEVGDEIMWVVTAGNHTTLSPDPNACGADLNRGSFGFAKITNIVGPNNQIWTLDEAITNDPGNVNNTNLSSAVADSTIDFCRIQVVRVANFNTINVGTATTLNANAFDHTLGKGGIIAIRAKTLNLAANFTIDVTGLGNPGSNGASAAQGSGLAGGNTTPSTSSLQNGGGSGLSTGDGGGGGANQGAGGTGAATTTGGQGGNALTFCSGQCLPMRDKKVFFGGGGGAGSSGAGTNGGDGGGIVVLHIENIAGSGTLTINADGAINTAGSDSGGSGAGGMIHLTAKSVNSSTSFSASGGAATTEGGSGGGGAIEVPFCSSLSSTPPSAASGDVAAGTVASGSAGISGVKQISDEPLLCLAQ